MDTLRRLGVFSLLTALLLFVLFDQTQNTGIDWRDDLLVYAIGCTLLGLFLVTRFRNRPEKSSRFSGIKNWLFKSPEKKKQRKAKREKKA